MLDQLQKLQHDLEEIALAGWEIELCHVLLEMAASNMLAPDQVEIDNQMVCCWSAINADSMFDRVAGMDDLFRQAIMTLFLEGRLKFSVDDNSGHSDIRWHLSTDFDQPPKVSIVPC